jgi:hypothetical protein
MRTYTKRMHGLVMAAAVAVAMGSAWYRLRRQQLLAWEIWATSLPRGKFMPSRKRL